MTKKTKIILIVVLAVILIIAGSLYFAREYIEKQLFKPTETVLEQPDIELDTSLEAEIDEISEEPVDKEPIKIITENLQIPWEIDFLPDGDMLVTERPGTLKRIGQNNKTYEIEGVKHIGEGGLMGMALHPDFENNNWLYLYLTTESNGGTINRVERYKYSDDQLSEKQTIVDNIPGAIYHDGGRIEFGPDGYLYITTGDATNEPLSQDINSLAGKILRVKDDGTIPSDNPFGNAVYSYGHRNPQGIAWDSKGQLWATEHGPSGTQTGNDEINLIEPGQNYGWPNIQGDQTNTAMITPVINSGVDETWAPAGMAYVDDFLVFAGLRGESLYKAVIGEDNQINLSAYYRQDYGRLRAVVLGPNEYLFVSTSNTDGRGTPNVGDDKIIRLDPSLFSN